MHVSSAHVSAHRLAHWEFWGKLHGHLSFAKGILPPENPMNTVFDEEWVRLMHYRSSTVRFPDPNGGKSPFFSHQARFRLHVTASTDTNGTAWNPKNKSSHTSEWPFRYLKIIFIIPGNGFFLLDKTVLDSCKASTCDSSSPQSPCSHMSGYFS